MFLYYGYKHSFLYWLFIGWWLWLILLPFKIMWWTVKFIPKIVFTVGAYSLWIGGGIMLIALCGGWFAIALVLGLGYGLIKLFFPKKAC